MSCCICLSHLVKLCVHGVDLSLSFFSTVTVLWKQISTVVSLLTLTAERAGDLQTYTFVHVSSDADEGVGQSAGAAKLVRLRGAEVTEHSLHVEAQQESQEAARLTLLEEMHRRQFKSSSHAEFRREIYTQILT